jgi:integrase
MILCPQCGSTEFWKDGLRYLPNGDPVQRFLCRNCGYRFSELSHKLNVAGKLSKTLDPRTDHLNRVILKGKPSLKEASNDFPLTFSEDVGSHKVSIVAKELNSFPFYNSNRQVCALDKKAKNLAAAEMEKQTVAGTSPITQQDIKGKLVEFAFWMQKQGYKESTIRTRITRLEMLVRRGAKLYDPESIKETIALQKTWSDGTKANVVDAYTCFLEKESLTWKPPRYTRIETIPFIPSEAELNMLIGSCSKVLGTFLHGLKETGADPGELAAVTSKDINKEARTITLNRPVKGHRPRILTVSQELIRRLEAITKDECRIFDDEQLRRAFYYKRKTTAHKLSNPRLLNITFITVRHWFGTMEYHKTKDILHVQRLLGHKNIQNTLIYIDLETKLFNNTSEGFTSRVAHNVGEVCSLVESGFEYVTGEYNDGGKIFRKRL